MKKIVLIGGGSGLADVLPVFLRARSLETVAVVSTFDSGGSTGRLRQQFKIPAVGDLRHLLSASQPAEISQLLESRTTDGHAVGNLLFAFLAQQQGFEKTCKELLPANIFPVSFDTADLQINFQKKKSLLGERYLDMPPASYKKAKVESLTLTKKVTLNPAVKKALRSADLIAVGPGSLLGSLLPNFLVDDFAVTFQKSKAKKIFVAPGRPEFGYLGESAEEMAERFPVEFDEILENPGRRWEAQQLLAEIKRVLR